MSTIPVEFKKSGTTLQYQSNEHLPMSLVDLAFDEGLMLRAGCRNGYCHTCKCKVLSGEVKHFFEVQNVKEDECLPCCAYPLSPLSIDA